MKRSTFATLSLVAVFAMILASSVSAQTTFLSENFDSVAGGTTPPANWTTFNPSSALLWSFDNPGGADQSGFSGGVAGIDSDDFGSGFTHDAFLQSPNVDVSSAATLLLGFNHHVRHNGAQNCTVQIFDGTMYNVVASFTGADVGSGAAPVAEQFDVTALAGGAINANLQFRYEAGFDWWWFVDDVTLFEPAAFDVLNNGITGPVIDPNSCVHTLTNAENISIDIVNNGGVALAGTDVVRVFVDFDSVNVLVENVALTGGVAAGATFAYTSSGTVDLSPTGAHTLDTNVVLLTQVDSDPSNNTSSLAYTSPAATPETFGYVEDFDSLPSNNGSFSMTVFDVPAGWVNALDDAASLAGNSAPNWGPNDGGTGSSSGAVGPNGDHTQGPGSPGIYMYIEDSPSQPGDIELRSPCLNTAGATGNPTVSFWHNSVATAGATNDNILEVDVINESTGGTVTMSLLSLPGNGAQVWVNHSLDLTAFVPDVIRVQFRTNNDNGTFTDDLAIDDFSFADVVASSGQAPRPGMSVFDMNSSLNGNLQSVSSGANGPYFANVTQGSALNMTWEGIANQPLTCLVGNLNVQSATYPGGIGQFDIGGPGVDGAGLPLGINALFDGITYYQAPSGFPFDAFFVVGPAGNGGVSVTMPVFGLAPGTILTTFQCVMTDPVAPFFYISNAIELTVN